MLAGLGNQLFIYAFMRWVQLQVGQPACVLVSPIPHQHSYYQLYQYRITDQMTALPDQGSWAAYAPDFVAECETEVGRAARAGDLMTRAEALRITQPQLNEKGLFIMFDGYCPMNVRPGLRHYYIHGNFQSPLYTDPVKSVLFNELLPVGILDFTNLNMHRLIQSTPNSVCVHVRRGDFTNHGSNTVLDVCGAAYYHKAIRNMIQKCPGASFFVFSNGMEWVKENILFPHGAHYVEINKEDNPVKEMELMRACDHFIIANSTFSWWAQYLGKNPNKIVIAPSRFFNMNIPSDIRQPNWIVLDP